MRYPNNFKTQFWVCAEFIFNNRDDVLVELLFKILFKFGAITYLMCLSLFI